MPSLSSAADARDGRGVNTVELTGSTGRDVPGKCQRQTSFLEITTEPVPQGKKRVMGKKKELYLSKFVGEKEKDELACLDTKAARESRWASDRSRKKVFYSEDKLILERSHEMIRPSMHQVAVSILM